MDRPRQCYGGGGWAAVEMMDVSDECHKWCIDRNIKGKYQNILDVIF
jgi:hypothetical protein